MMCLNWSILYQRDNTAITTNTTLSYLKVMYEDNLISAWASSRRKISACFSADCVKGNNTVSNRNSQETVTCYFASLSFQGLCVGFFPD